ncbi:hypothetical protein ARMGADRAFT_87885 [Armillaria gallica]|uniref:Uncharacterized protein n=1 Tax=Armillaria gallica TaxID=47427 RepID=A0A2H3CAP2_ARMGA|nr:hypothetical protein ARMGADRAFT_87885 [Armillaria gallica]
MEDEESLPVRLCQIPRPSRRLSHPPRGEERRECTDCVREVQNTTTRARRWLCTNIDQRLVTTKSALPTRLLAC